MLGMEDKQDKCAFAAAASGAALTQQPLFRGVGGLVDVWNLRQQRRKTPSPPERARKRLIVKWSLLN